MVAVKMLWVLWKSFSTNFSFNNNNESSSSKENHRVRYSRLRPPNKSTSHPTNLTLQSEDKKGVKSFTSCGRTDANGNQISEGAAGELSSTPDSSSSPQSDWRYDFDNSDSDCEDQQDFASDDESSNFDDEDESRTCDVCDRAFATQRKLAIHQEKKRHFGCLQCDSIFPSRQSLEHHREQMDHYDFASDNYESSFDDDDEESFDDDEEDRERLL